jgi:hypothetical protein
MSKQILSEDFRRMQRLAGIITEGQQNENFAANFAARGGFNTKYGSGTSSSSTSPSDSKDGNQGDSAKKANEKVLAFFSDVDKDQAFKSQVDKIEADFNTAWNTDKERYEKTGKWNQTRQDSLKGEWDRKKETLFLKKFGEENQDLKASDPGLFSAAYGLVSKIAMGKTKVEDLKAPASSPSLLGKIKGFFSEDKTKKQITKEEFMEKLNEQYLRMQRLAGIITEEQLNEEKIPFFHLDQILNLADLSKPKADQMADLKVGLIVLPKKYYKNEGDIKQSVGKVAKIEGDKVTVEKVNGDLENRAVSDLVHLIDGGYRF